MTPSVTSSPHRATITVEWSPSASTGEPEATGALLERHCELLMVGLLASSVVDPSVTLEYDPEGPA